jgi:sirohydrochlorin ferrochelatase
LESAQKTGFVVFAHGSSLAAANEAVEAAARALARHGGYAHVRAAFLDPVSPGLGDAVASLAEAGVSRVIVIPYFLTSGIHLQRDLPRIVERLVRIHNLEIQVSASLDGHPALVDILLDRARQYLSGAAEGEPRNNR